MTGPRWQLQGAMDAEDEPGLRRPLATAARVDMRYCPSWRHAKLLLSLLAADVNPTSAQLVERPALIVLADLAGLFERDADEAKENLPPEPAEGSTEEDGETSTSKDAGEMGKDAWEYWSLVSAARQAAEDLGAALVVLEHAEREITVPGGGRALPLTSGLEKILGHVVTTRGECGLGG